MEFVGLFFDLGFVWTSANGFWNMMDRLSTARGKGGLGSVRSGRLFGWCWPAHSRGHCLHEQCLSVRIVFFSHNNLVGTVFLLIFQASRTTCGLPYIVDFVVILISLTLYKATTDPCCCWHRPQCNINNNRARHFLSSSTSVLLIRS